ncbi:vegetative cell wall protein gp1-like [Oryza sativa Japonica Group]|uniref:vegetative cell wall protein gp1-like n=1 Tax=Oryza sativa subsp. japonica TaxID=39947 RepID=UPI00339CD160
MAAFHGRRAPFPPPFPAPPVAGSFPSAIKWNPLFAFYRFSPFPSSPATTPPLPASSSSFLGAGHPPAAPTASPTRRPAVPPPSPASQQSPLPRPALRFARRPLEVRPRRQLWRCRHCSASGRHCGVSRAPADVATTSLGSATPPSSPASPPPRPKLAGVASSSASSTSPPLAGSCTSPVRRSTSPRCPLLQLLLCFAGTPSPVLASPSSSSPTSLRPPVHPRRLVVSRRRLRRRIRSGAFHVVPVSVQLPPAALVVSSPAPVVVVVVLSSFPVVVAFVPPSSRSRPPPAFRQVCSSPVVVLVLGSASSSLVPAASRLRPRIAAEVVPSPFASIVPELSPPRPFVVVVPTPRRVVACSFACVLRVASVVPEVPEAWFAVVAEGSEGRSL